MKNFNSFNHYSSPENKVDADHRDEFGNLIFTKKGLNLKDANFYDRASFSGKNLGDLDVSSRLYGGYNTKNPITSMLTFDNGDRIFTHRGYRGFLKFENGKMNLAGIEDIADKGEDFNPYDNIILGEPGVSGKAPVQLDVYNEDHVGSGNNNNQGLRVVRRNLSRMIIDHYEGKNR